MRSTYHAQSYPALTDETFFSLNIKTFIQYNPRHKSPMNHLDISVKYVGIGGHLYTVLMLQWLHWKPRVNAPFEPAGAGRRVERGCCRRGRSLPVGSALAAF